MPKLQLHTKILLGLVAGVILGVLANRLGFSGFVVGYIKPLGSIFIKLISMVVVPLEGIAIIWGAERILDMCRSVVNVTGDASCAVVVAASEDR